ncbi:MAG: helix-turn-helix transcriptional regulator [Clostridiales bacterium]|nr:helix-turn-helix transcriptional regulator [Clostridiales bacterium]
MNNNFEIKNIQIRRFYTGKLCEDMENVRHEKICNELSIVQAIEGSYDISIGSSSTFSTGEGGVFIAPSNVLQTIVHHNGKDGKMRAHWIFIDAIINDQFGLDELFSFPIVLNSSYNEKVFSALETIKNTKDCFERIRAEYELLEILVKEGNKKKKSDTLKTMIETYVCNHYFENIGASEIARNINYSPAQVYKLVKKYFALSPANYINSVRLQKAEQMLVSSDRNVTEISLAVGYDDCAYFSKLFKKSYGYSPQNYRKVALSNFQFY